MRACIGALLIVVSGCVCSCNHDKERIKTKALWLCQNDQLVEPTPEVFSKAVDLTRYIARDDLTYLEQRKSETKESTDVFGGLAKALGLALEPTKRAIAQVMARHTMCEVKKIEIVDGNATVEVEQTRPRLDSAGTFQRLSEFMGLDSQEERIVRIEEWIGEAKGSVTQT